MAGARVETSTSSAALVSLSGYDILTTPTSGILENDSIDNSDNLTSVHTNWAADSAAVFEAQSVEGQELSTSDHCMMSTPLSSPLGASHAEKCTTCNDG